MERERGGRCCCCFFCTEIIRHAYNYCEARRFSENPMAPLPSPKLQAAPFPPRYRPKHRNHKGTTSQASVPAPLWDLCSLAASHDASIPSINEMIRGFSSLVRGAGGGEQAKARPARGEGGGVRDPSLAAVPIARSPLPRPRAWDTRSLFFSSVAPFYPAVGELEETYVRCILRACVRVCAFFRAGLALSLHWPDVDRTRKY